MEVAAAALIALYTAANTALLVGFARLIRDGAAGALSAGAVLARARRLSEAQANIVKNRSAGLLVTLFHHVAAEADERAGHQPVRLPEYASHAITAAQAIQDELAGRFERVQSNILHAADDLYRSVVSAAATRQVLGATPQEAQAQAFAQFVERGITGYTDAAGRRWELSTYVEMATRTAALRAYNVSYEGRLQAAGVRYFTVPNDGHPCPYCWPWQGKILTPRAPDDIAQHTVEEARAEGLFHPQCRHVLLPYFPGVSKPPTPDAPWSDEQAAKYAATQRLRSLERRVRGQKVARDHAVTPESRQALQRRVRATEATIREHVAEHGLVRRRHRESTP